jgi:hypothetical protein
VASHHGPAVPALGIEALRTLGTAWGNLGAYPSGHPALARALDRAYAALRQWLDADGDLVLGVRRRSFLVGEATLESPQATKLARALYERSVAVVRIDTGVQIEELTALLRVLTGRPDRPDRLPAWDELAAAGVEHIHLQPVDYSLIRVTSDLGSDEPGPGDADLGPAASESLTEGIVRILMERTPREGVGRPLWDQLLTVQDRIKAGQPPPGGGVAGSPGEAPGGGSEGGGGPGGVGDPGPGSASGPGAMVGGLNDATAALANLIAAYANESAAAARGSDAVESPHVAAGAGAGGSGAPATTEAPAERPSVAGAMRGVTAGAEAPGEGRLSSRVDVLGVALGAVESHLTRPGERARLLAARQTAELALALPPAVRDIVMKTALRVLGVREDGSTLHAFSSPFAPDSVVRVLAFLAREGVTLSKHALLLIQTMAAIRLMSSQPPGEEEEGDVLPDALRAEIIALFREDDVDRFNPEDHQALLTRVALEVPAAPRASADAMAALGDRVESLGDDILAEQLGDALLELLAHPPATTGGGSIAARLEALFRLFLARGRLEQAVHVAQAMKTMVEGAEQPGEIRTLVAAGLARLSGVDALAGLAVLAPSDHSGAARRLIALLGPVAVDSLLFVLIEEQNRSYRRHVFDMLVSLGAVIIPGARRWLGDERWYVVRNMIGLLRAADDRTSLPDVYLLVGHPDPRVRLEALRSLLALRAPEGVDALVRMIDDPDSGVASAAIVLAGEYRPPEVVEALVRALDGWDLFHRRRTARLNALRALARIGDPAALPRLSRFYDSWLAALLAREERREAYRSLAGYLEPDRRAIVGRGLASADDEVRRICRELAAAGSRGGA